MYDNTEQNKLHSEIHSLPDLFLAKDKKSHPTGVYKRAKYSVNQPATVYHLFYKTT